MNKKQLVDEFENKLNEFRINFHRHGQYHIQVMRVHNFYPSTKKYYNSMTDESIIYKDDILIDVNSFMSFLGVKMFKARDESEVAKELINQIYQPTGFIKHSENSDFMWDWAKNRAIEFVDYIIDITNEGSSVWLRHQNIKEEINKL